MVPAPRGVASGVRALILHGAGDLRLEDVPDPQPAPGEVVVRVLAAVTCATDAKMMRVGAHPALGPTPAPLGHEVAGVVETVGAGVDRPRVGDRVVVANSAPCGACADCRAGAPNLCPRIVYLTGAFAERLRVPAAIVARNMHPLPEGLAPEAGAVAEPLACALHSTRRCGPGGGREVLVLGGGVQGQFIAALLARAGDRVHLADPHPRRRERALRLGAVAAHEAPREAAAARALAARPRRRPGAGPGRRGGRPDRDVAHGGRDRAARRDRAGARRVPGGLAGRAADRAHSLFRDHAARIVSPHTRRLRARPRDDRRP